MNKRIKELRYEAMDIVSSQPSEEDHPFETYEEVLCELIVRECTNMLPEDSVRNEDGVHMFYVIREHFGVSVFGR